MTSEEQRQRDDRRNTAVPVAREHRQRQRRTSHRHVGNVSQQEIANMLGIDRTAVTKILNNTPGHLASPETIRRVWELAKQLGWVSIEKRNTPRKNACIATTFLIIRKDTDTICTSGNGFFLNISTEGALLLIAEIDNAALPLQPFRIQCTFSDLKKPGGVIADLRHPTEQEGEVLYRLGIRFLQFFGEGEAYILQHAPQGEDA